MKGEMDASLLDEIETGRDNNCFFCLLLHILSPSSLPVHFHIVFFFESSEGFLQESPNDKIYILRT